MIIGMLCTMTNGRLTYEKNHVYNVPEALGKALIDAGASFQAGIGFPDERAPLKIIQMERRI